MAGSLTTERRAMPPSLRMQLGVDQVCCSSSQSSNNKTQVQAQHSTAQHVTHNTLSIATTTIINTSIVEHVTISAIVKKCERCTNLLGCCLDLELRGLRSELVTMGSTGFAVQRLPVSREGVLAGSPRTPLSCHPTLKPGGETHSSIES